MKRMFSEAGGWRSAIGEVVLIVLGILIALGIDSLAGARADQRQADAYVGDLILELRSDSAEFEGRAAGVTAMTRAASELLLLVQTGNHDGPDAGALLIQSLFGEAITKEAVVWEELKATGSLRLIRTQGHRSAIVGHYLDRSAKFGIVEANFTPAVRALRAVAWDVLPVNAIPSYMTSGSTGVPSSEVLASLRDRADTAFLLKRLIATSTVAERNIRGVVLSTSDLLETLDR